MLSTKPVLAVRHCFDEVFVQLLGVEMSDILIGCEVGVINLGKTVGLWGFERQLLLEKSKGVHDAGAKVALNFAINNPGLFAPLSTLLSGGVEFAGDFLSSVVNRRNLEAGTRERVLTQVLRLHGTQYSEISWANTIEIIYYVGWLIGELNDRLQRLREIDISVCNDSESEFVKSKVGEYVAVVGELVSFRSGVEARRKSWDEMAKDFEGSKFKANQDLLNSYSLKVDVIHKKLKNLSAKKDAILISQKEAKEQELALKKELNCIRSDMCCAIGGCEDLKFSGSDYCGKHRCKNLGCNGHVASVLDGIPLLFNSALKGAVRLAGNANSEHILEMMGMFCEAHQSTLNVDSFGSDVCYTAEEDIVGGDLKRPILAGIFVLAFLAIMLAFLF